MSFVKGACVRRGCRAGVGRRSKVSQEAVLETPLQGTEETLQYMVHVHNNFHTTWTVAFTCRNLGVHMLLALSTRGRDKAREAETAPLLVLEVQRCVEREEVARKSSVCEER